MIKIGLLNIQNVDNYGANLIAFSMEQELMQMELLDKEVITLNYCPDIKMSRRQAFSILNSYRQFGMKGSLKAMKAAMYRSKGYCLRMVRSTILYKKLKKVFRREGVLSSSAEDVGAEDHKIRLQRFDAFHKECLHLSEIITSADTAQLEYDIIIVGSDVVWKPARLLAKEENKAYFLLDMKSCKKIAYAASIGMADEIVLGRLKKRYTEAINRFDYISVREKSAQKYLQSLLPDRDVMHCIDPVFLRKPDEYLNLIKDLKWDKYEYIYVYLMGNNREAYQYAQILAKEKQLSIIYHTNFSHLTFQGESSITDGPREFIHRIYNAQYIITDTFHGTAFSIIFRKRFISFTRGNMSIRLEDFLSGMDLKDRLAETAEDAVIIDRPIDYDAVGYKINSWVNLSRDWLREAVYASAEALITKESEMP